MPGHSKSARHVAKIVWTEKNKERTFSAAKNWPQFSVFRKAQCIIDEKPENSMKAIANQLQMATTRLVFHEDIKQISYVIKIRQFMCNITRRKRVSRSKGLLTMSSNSTIILLLTVGSQLLLIKILWSGASLSGRPTSKSTIRRNRWRYLSMSSRLTWIKDTWSTNVIVLKQYRVRHQRWW